MATKIQVVLQQRDGKLHRMSHEVLSAGQRLRSDTGWLTLVGLHDLGFGVNTVGSAEDADVRLIDKAPARVGALEIPKTAKGHRCERCKSKPKSRPIARIRHMFSPARR